MAKARLGSTRIPVSLALGGATPAATIGRITLTRVAAAVVVTQAAPSVTITVEASP